MPSSISSSCSAMITPFPEASPSAFRTTLFFKFLSLSSFAYLIASSEFVKVLYSAVGIFSSFKTSFVNSFEPSSLEAFLSGPNILSPAPLKTSTMPSQRGASGPTIVKSTFSFFAKSKSFEISVSPISTFLPMSCVPPLPGAKISSTSLPR